MILEILLAITGRSRQLLLEVILEIIHAILLEVILEKNLLRVENRELSVIFSPKQRHIGQTSTPYEGNGNHRKRIYPSGEEL